MNASLDPATPYDRIATGTAAAGWRYRRIEAQLRSADHTVHVDALGFAADLGDQVALVLGVGQLSGRCFLDHWPAFFHALAFAGHEPRPDALRDALIGTWRYTTITSDHLQEYAFTADGRYARGAGYSTATSTTTVAGDGSWELRGAELVLTSDAGQVTTAPIRIEHVVESQAYRRDWLYLGEVDYFRVED
jgi:hypothetical protein